MTLVANCYNHKTEMIIGRFNEDGSENPSITFTDKAGEEITWHYKPTTEKNGTKVIIPSKRINRDKYAQAVKSQLLYFDKVKFFITQEHGYKSEETFKARVLYNSNNIIISDNNYYSKPHVLIVKDAASTEAVCYGYVDFREMEMEELFSSVGIKCTIRSVIKNEDTGEEQVLQEGVSVTPSRESILFDDHTRNYIITKFKEVQEEASQLVSDKLKEKDFLAWIDKASNALSNSGSDPILNRLSKIINKEEINPIFPGTKIKYLSNPNAMFPGFYIKEVFLANEYKNGRYEFRLKREFANTGWINPTLIFFKDADTDREKDHYLQSYASSLGYSKFYLVEEMAEDLYIGSPKLNKDRSLFSEEELDAIEEKHKKSRLDAKAEIWQLYSSSKHFKNYSEVDIPEDWLKTFRDKNKEEEDTVEQVKIKALSPKEQRALAAKTVCYRPVSRGGYNTDEDLFKWRKQEPLIAELKDGTFSNSYYGGTEDEMSLKLIALLSKETVTAFRVSSANVKHFKSLKKVKTFFEKIDNNNTITMSPELINWYTGYLIHEASHKFKFLKGWKSFNVEIFEIYETLLAFHEKYYRHLYKDIYEFKDSEAGADMLETCGKILQLQTYAMEHTDEVEIKTKASELFGLEYKNGKAVINEYYQLLLVLEDYCESVYPLLNEIPLLVDGKYVPNQVEHLIKEFIEVKGLNEFEWDKSLMDNIKTPPQDVTEQAETPEFEEASTDTE